MNTLLSNIRSLLQTENLDALLISSQPNITYVTGYSGFSSIEREAFILVTKTGQYLFTDGRYSEAVKKSVTGYEVKEITALTPFSHLLKETIEKKSIKLLGIEEDNLTVKEFKKIRKTVRKTVDVGLNTFRVRKTSHEITKIQKACQIGDKAFSHILGIIKPGLTEKDIAFEIEYAIKKQNADISFPPIVAFGKNAATPHHQTGNDKLSKRSLILLDFGAKYEEYCSDMTRTIFIGNATNEEKKMYETVFTAQKKAIEKIHNGVKGSLIDSIAREYIVKTGFPTIPHSLGHGIGLEVHEAPRLSPKSKDILTSDMVFSVEPGIYLPTIGGVRIEDLVTIQNKTVMELTQSPKKLIIL